LERQLETEAKEEKGDYFQVHVVLKEAERNLRVKRAGWGRRENTLHLGGDHKRSKLKNRLPQKNSL